MHAVITLRDGSKRFPGKCFADGPRGPLAFAAIDLALEVLPSVVVSTDSADYAERVRSEFGRVPGLMIMPRSNEWYSGDNATVVDVLRDVAASLHESGYATPSSWLVWIDATKPNTTASMVREVVATCSGRDSVFTCKPFSGYLTDDPAVNSQDLPPRSEMFGAVRARTVKTLLSSMDPWARGVRHIDLPCVPWWHVDVNTPEHLRAAIALEREFCGTSSR